MQLISKKSFAYGGRRLAPGERFDASKKDAALLVTVKYAEFHEPAAARPVEKKTADYKKQSMAVEDSSTETKKPAKKRQYKRRDMKADD